MKAAREHLGLNQDGLAQAVGVSKRGIQANERQISVPGGEVICGMVQLGINANWLLTGEGPMLLRDLVHQVELSELEDQPLPATAETLDATVLAVCIRGIIEARPEATPAQIAHHAIEFYQRLMHMEAGQDTDAA